MWPTLSPPFTQGRRSGTYPFIKVSDMNLAGNETHIRHSNNYVEALDLVELGTEPFPSGTVVFPKVGAAIATNKKRVLTVPTVIYNNMIGISVLADGQCDSGFLFDRLIQIRKRKCRPVHHGIASETNAGSAPAAS